MAKMNEFTILLRKAASAVEELADYVDSNEQIKKDLIERHEWIETYTSVANVLDFLLRYYCE